MVNRLLSLFVHLMVRPSTDACVTRPFLAAERVRFVGEPVAAVVAETLAQAMDAAELVLVDYEPLPVLTDLARSVAGDELMFPDAGANTDILLVRRGRAAEAGDKDKNQNRGDRAHCAEQHERVTPRQHDNQQCRRGRHRHFSDVAREVIGAECLQRARAGKRMRDQ